MSSVLWFVGTWVQVATLLLLGIVGFAAVCLFCCWLARRVWQRDREGG